MTRLECESYEKYQIIYIPRTYQLKTPTILMNLRYRLLLCINTKHHNYTHVHIGSITR